MNLSLSRPRRVLNFSCDHSFLDPFMEVSVGLSWIHDSYSQAWFHIEINLNAALTRILARWLYRMQEFEIQHYPK